MITLCVPDELTRWCDDARARGQRIGLVPTMGFLHEGHMSLARLARRQADRVVVSIFVNPQQFGPNEDLERYPRDPHGDARQCREAGVDVLFVPTVSQMYPTGYQTTVRVAAMSRGLCGEHRPGHFDGVCTVVAKLLNIVGPCAAVFGQKDYQQYKVLARMVADLNMPVQMVRGATAREPDGLALSSRNVYLSSEQRRAATSLHRALTGAQLRVREGAASVEEVVALVRAAIEAEPQVRVEYIEARDADTLEPVERVETGRAVVALAVHLGATRLIDNILM